MRAVVAALLLATPAAAQLSPRELAAAVARPAPHAALPAPLAFTDQRGQATTLGAVAGGYPLVLIFADYQCRHLCAPGVVLTAAALHARPARDYRFAVIGLAPQQGIAAARQFAGMVPDADVARATSFLTGTPASVAAATRALGYGYAYDAAAGQFAHDAVVYVFGADGRLVTLLPELGVTPASLRAALAGTPAPGIGDRIAHLCYGLLAAHGRYGRLVVVALQAAALLTLVAVGGFIWRRRHV